MPATSPPITPDTVLLSVVHANNETGTIQPSAGIARAAQTAGVLLHVNAAQSAGKIEGDVVALGADLLTVVGHKLSAPKGIVRSTLVEVPCSAFALF